jgi:hypothetical protein
MVTNEILELKTVVNTLDNVQDRLLSHLDLTQEIIAAFENTLNKSKRQAASSELIA